jgi:hypothetical protein
MGEGASAQRSEATSRKSADRRITRKPPRVDTRRVESVGPQSAPDPVLTPAQMRFAREHGARPGFARVSDGSVFFYRRHYRGTERWLVDISGTVLEFASFRGPAAARDEEGDPSAIGRDDSEGS